MDHLHNTHYYFDLLYSLDTLNNVFHLRDQYLHRMYLDMVFYWDYCLLYNFCYSNQVLFQVDKFSIFLLLLLFHYYRKYLLYIVSLQIMLLYTQDTVYKLQYLEDYNVFALYQRKKFNTIFSQHPVPFHSDKFNTFHSLIGFTFHHIYQAHILNFISELECR